MTIGIGAAGPHAGKAVFEALRHAERASMGERIGEGSSLWGFVVYVAIAQDGEVITYTTQRGGTSTLRTVGEETGIEIDEKTSEARIAGVISSGPDRTEPLAQFLPAKEGVGLVTGHRLPNTPCRVTGIPINVRVLELMEKGMPPQDAVNKVILEDNPHVDAGLIAINVSGEIGAVNSPRVLERFDVKHARAEDSETGAIVEVFHNEVFPMVIGDLVCAVAIDRMTKERQTPDFYITLRAGTKVEPVGEDSLEVDDKLVVKAVRSFDPYIGEGERSVAMPYVHSKVIQGGEVIGITLAETFGEVKDGVIVSLAGQEVFSIPAKKGKGA